MWCYSVFFFGKVGVTLQALALDVCRVFVSTVRCPPYLQVVFRVDFPVATWCVRSREQALY